MIKSLTGLIFFIFFCSVIAATLNVNSTINGSNKASEHNFAATYYLATQGSRL